MDYADSIFHAYQRQRAYRLPVNCKRIDHSGRDHGHRRFAAASGDFDCRHDVDPATGASIM